MTAISKRAVDAAQPGARDVFLWDDQLRGFGLKVTPAGGRIYVVQYRTGGRGSPTKRVTIGRHGAPWTPDQARRKAKAILGEVASGRDPAGEKRATREAAKRQREALGERSLEAVAGRWFNHQRREGKRSADEVERSFRRHVYHDLGARDVATIARADAHRLYERLADAGHAPMGHQLVRNLKALLSYAVERDLIPVNPLLRIKLPNLEARERVLIAFHPEREPDPAELMAVWHAADQLAEPRRTFVRVLILSIQREDEVAGMEWPELDGALWRIPADRHKAKRGHVVPLPEPAIEMIEALPRVIKRVDGQGEVELPHVFYSGRGDHLGDFSAIKDEINSIIARTNAERRLGRKLAEGEQPKETDAPAPWRWHDLRRSGGTWIEEELGREIMHAVLGHSLGNRLAETYARGPGYRRKKRALAAWADFVTGATGENVVPLAAPQ